MKRPRITITIAADWVKPSEATEAILLRLSELMDDAGMTDQPGWTMEARTVSPCGDLLAPVRVRFTPMVEFST